MKYLDVELKRIALTRGESRVLRNVSWRVRPGQRWALLGHKRCRQDTAAQSASR